MTGKLRHSADLQSELHEIIQKLGAGEGLPERYYRAGIDRDYDALLSDTGIKHLHLGGQNSDVLLYVVEYTSAVLLLQINGHIHFRTRPAGKLLRQLYGSEMTRLGAAAALAGIATAIAASTKKKRDK